MAGTIISNFMFIGTTNLNKEALWTGILSEVRMEYRSAPLHACAKVSLIAVILLIAIAAVVLVRKRKA